MNKFELLLVSNMSLHWGGKKGERGEGVGKKVEQYNWWGHVSGEKNGRGRKV